jgi:AraC-like DNA-binding protein
MYIPNEKLKDWIKVFWFLEGHGNGKLSHTRNILPDGCATITFVLQGNMDLTIYDNSVIKRGIYVIPPVVNAHYDVISDDIFLIDIQLNPSIFYKLFNLPVNELENKIYTFDELSLNFDKSILEKIYDVRNDKSAICSLLNNYFITLFDRLKFNSDEIILNINQLYKYGDLDNFLHSQNLSIRQIERKVKNYTGLTPQSISRLGRFYSVLEYMKFRQFNIEYCELALEHKFSDQSHFIREFKYFTKLTPKKFIKDVNDFPQFKGLCNITKIIN